MAQCGATCFSMQWEEFAVKLVTWDGCDSDISDRSADSPRHLPLCAATGLLTQGKGLAEMQGKKLVGRRTVALPKSGG